MSSLLIVNAILVNEGQMVEGGIFLEEGRIQQIGDVSHLKADQTLDAGGKYLLPGMIDDQVHFREPGTGEKGDIASESAAAVAGGITSFMEMPNTSPPTLTIEELNKKYVRASDRAYANYAFYMGTSNDNLDDIRQLRPNDACGIKIFMGASTGNMLVDDPEVLGKIFDEAPILIATHCEDTPTILQNEARYREQYGENVSFSEHPNIRSEEACYLSSSLAVELAKKHGTRLHVLHLTTERELALFDQGPIAGKQITAEVCVHHLWFDESDYADKGALIKCNPAIKKASDKAALRQAVKQNVLDVIATDHAPHTWEEKQGSYFNAPSGLPLVQHAMLSLLDFVHAGEFTLPQVVQKTSHAVADCYGVVERGYLREGYWGDLVLVDMENPTDVTQESLLYRCGWSPFMGHRFKSRIMTTIVNGEIAWDGKVMCRAAGGQRLNFNQNF